MNLWVQASRNDTLVRSASYLYVETRILSSICRTRYWCRPAGLRVASWFKSGIFLAEMMCKRGFFLNTKKKKNFKQATDPPANQEANHTTS